MTEQPELLGKADFARLVLKRSPSYVTALLQDGRLVIEGEGKHAKVRVAESLARIAATRGGRDDVAARHAANAGSEIPEAQPSPENAPTAAGEVAVTLRERRAEADLRRTTALAQQEEMVAAKMRGDLVAREDVDTAMKIVGTSVRGLLDVLPDQLAPVLAPVSDLDEIHAILVDHCRNVLERLGQSIHAQREQLSIRGVARE